MCQKATKRINTLVPNNNCQAFEWVIGPPCQLSAPCQLWPVFVFFFFYQWMNESFPRRRMLEIFVFFCEIQDLIHSLHISIDRNDYSLDALLICCGIEMSVLFLFVMPIHETNGKVINQTIWREKCIKSWIGKIITSLKWFSIAVLGSSQEKWHQQKLRSHMRQGNVNNQWAIL